MHFPASRFRLSQLLPTTQPKRSDSRPFTVLVAWRFDNPSAARGVPHNTLAQIKRKISGETDTTGAREASPVPVPTDEGSFEVSKLVQL